MINMAKREIVTFVDDMDGSEATETIAFAVGKDSYEIDLSEANASKLREAFGPFIAKARKLTGRRKGHLTVHTGGQSASADREQNQAIREWARKRGMKVADRGRIPEEVTEAYHRDGAQKPATAPEASALPVAGEVVPRAVTERIAAAVNPAPAKTPGPRKPRAKRGNGAVEPPKAAATGWVTRLNKITSSMIDSLSGFAGEVVIDCGDTWVELRGNRDDIAAKITAVQSDMPGKTATDRAAKASLTRVVKELRNVKSRKVEERPAA